MIKKFLNPEWHQNHISGSKVTAILLKVEILPIGGASAGKGLRSMGLLRLVYITSVNLSKNFIQEINFLLFS